MKRSVRAVHVVGLALCVVASSLRAQNGSQFNDWKPPAAESATGPMSRCVDLQALTSYDFSVVSSEVIPTSGDVPEHCRVRGLIQPEIRFELDLPASWIRRLYMFGNGAFAGESLDAQLQVRQRMTALEHGFAVTYTNAGHDAAAEPLATFTTNPQKLVDFAFRSVHVTIETAKQLVRAYYGQAQSHTYFDGCSTGGRQGLTEAQRFPADFDGIIAGAPMLDYVGTMISTVWIDHALTSSHLASNKLKTLAQRIYARCDEKDGLKDGIIDDPRRCDFVPTRDLPACPVGADAQTCFSRAQIDALQTVYSDVMSSGKSLFPGWPLGGEIEGPNLFSASEHNPGWVPMLINDGGQSFAAQLTESFFRYMAYPRPDPTYQLTQFDFNRDPARIEPVRQLMDANDPDLSRFRDRGGKLLMYWGWADPALNPRMGNSGTTIASRSASDERRATSSVCLWPRECSTAPAASAPVRSMR